MSEFSTGMHHLVSLEPTLHHLTADKDAFGKAFADRRGVDYLGQDAEHRGLLRFADASNTTRQALGAAEFNVDFASWFIAIASARALKNVNLSPDTRRMAEAIAQKGLSPKARRTAWTIYRLSDNARLIEKLLAATGVADVHVDPLPSIDETSPTFDRRPRYHDAVRIGGRTNEISKACRAIMSAHADDRNPRRDGAMLRNVYGYFGDPWNREIDIQFHDTFGRSHIGAAAYPSIVWQMPGNVQFMAGDASKKHSAELSNYGWRLTVATFNDSGSQTARSSGPFSDLKLLLQTADRMTTHISRGRDVEMPTPTKVDILSAHKLRTAFAVSHRAYSHAVERFHNSNGIGASRERPFVRSPDHDLAC